MFGLSLSKFFAAAAGGGYLLDTYPAFAAYSVRKLSTSYTGACLRVRRSVGNEEQDFGFDANGWVDIDAIKTFCDANGSWGFVVKWYDQSGNGHDASQASASQQRYIYNGSLGAGIEVNGKTALLWVDTNSVFKTVAFTATTQPNTWFVVGKSEGENGYFFDGIAVGYLNRVSSNNLNKMLAYAGSNWASPLDDGQAQGIWSAFFNNTTGDILRLNGNTQNPPYGLGTQSPNGLTIGGVTSGSASVKYIQEVIFFNSDLSANMGDIEAEINTAFGVF